MDGREVEQAGVSRRPSRVQPVHQPAQLSGVPNGAGCNRSNRSRRTCPSPGVSADGSTSRLRLRDAHERRQRLGGGERSPYRPSTCAPKVWSIIVTTRNRIVVGARARRGARSSRAFVDVVIEQVGQKVGADLSVRDARIARGRDPIGYRYRISARRSVCPRCRPLVASPRQPAPDRCRRRADPAGRRTDREPGRSRRVPAEQGSDPPPDRPSTTAQSSATRGRSRSRAALPAQLHAPSRAPARREHRRIGIERRTPGAVQAPSDEKPWRSASCAPDEPVAVSGRLFRTGKEHDRQSGEASPAEQVDRAASRPRRSGASGVVAVELGLS